MRSVIFAKYEKSTIFLMGSVCYGLCELIWRGYTHPTMLLLGGICFEVLYLANKKFFPLPMYLKSFTGGVFITSAELVTGSLVNIAFKMNVWDYTEMPFNFLGQICPQFFCMWVALCVPALCLCDKLRSFFDAVYV